MGLNSEVVALLDEFKAIRHQIHQNPEIGLETVNTVKLVKSKLDEYSIPYKDIGVNSLVAEIKGNAGDTTVAFRVDMDALEMSEENDFAYKSQFEGRMHACGHDGHCTSLIALAAYLAKNRDFNGTVLLLFQSGEEGYEGALRVIEDGFFDKYKVDYLFGFHGWPGLASGKIAVHNGACMASEDRFEVHVTGKSGHASMPHVCNEPFAAVADIIKGLQTIVARKIPSHERGVLSITQVHGGSLRNGIPDNVMLQGNVRTCNEDVQDLIEESVAQVVKGAATIYGVEAELDYIRKHPVLVNSTPEVAIKAAQKVVGLENVVTDMESSMAAEDYAFFMKHTRGCYVWIGNGLDSAPLHNSKFDFNDDIMPIAASFFIAVIDELL
ncbi:amidohydrolase [Maridesulfovibrio hydrothermalis]|uniref:Amidohydrolase n=1 Tax=Maridesulfovibrio hydrothermalis AM13 = DSM 14728 TaxID=1121451 RepID=L0RFA5_9BACT|nr:amidohydrolase [Maridesulfovibrio hydrothermalis]CCO25458.1 Amidohydrolase [Maridesulfovibrio hydrothermalis AM13 = DSM 14728]